MAKGRISGLYLSASDLFALGVLEMGYELVELRKGSFSVWRYGKIVSYPRQKTAARRVVIEAVAAILRDSIGKREGK